MLMSLIKREQAYLQEWISILEVGIMRKYGISPQDFKERKVIRSISEIASHLRKKLHDTTFEKRGGFLLPSYFSLPLPFSSDGDSFQLCASWQLFCSSAALATLSTTFPFENGFISHGIYHLVSLFLTLSSTCVQKKEGIGRVSNRIRKTEMHCRRPKNIK